VSFNRRLAAIWLDRRLGGRLGSPVTFEPEHHWWFGPPPGARPWKIVDLSDLAYPQPLLLRPRSLPRSGPDRPLWAVSLLCAVAGPVVLLALRKILRR